LQASGQLPLWSLSFLGFTISLEKKNRIVNRTDFFLTAQARKAIWATYVALFLFAGWYFAAAAALCNWLTP
jgi:hypothetical protein